jgi:hypothetical protein
MLDSSQMDAADQCSGLAAVVLLIVIQPRPDWKRHKKVSRMHHDVICQSRSISGCVIFWSVTQGVELLPSIAAGNRLDRSARRGAAFGRCRGGEDVTRKSSHESEMFGHDELEGRRQDIRHADICLSAHKRCGECVSYRRKLRECEGSV